MMEAQREGDVWVTLRITLSFKHTHQTNFNPGLLDKTLLGFNRVPRWNVLC
jgi:hypothetical protein